MVQLAARPTSAVPHALEAPPERPSAWGGALPFLLLAVVGLLLRLHEVGARAYHHDESLHAVYSWYLYVGRGYVHDPLMHGPFQFHMTALIYFLFGDNNVTGRLAAVLYGTGMIGLPYFLRHELGRRGAIAASLLLTIGPCFLYFSRFTREDIYLAFFTLGMVVGIFGWIRTRNVRYLHFGSLMLILAFADKEATYIHGFTFVTFFVLLWVSAPIHSKWAPVWQALKDIPRRAWIECFAIFVVVYVVLFTTFFTNLGEPWKCAGQFLQGERPTCNLGGIWSGSVGALKYWIDQHDVQRGGQPYYYYVLLLGLYEFVPLIFAVAAATTRWFRQSLFGWFCAYWFLGNFVIYSWAGEKMPWLLPHLATPLVLLAGRWLGAWSKGLDRRVLLARPSLAVAGLGLLAVATASAFIAVGAVQTLTPLDSQTLTLERLTLAVLSIGAIGGIVYLALARKVRVARPLTLVALMVLGSFYIRTSWVATYQNADVPLDMLIYVQSSPDVPWVVDEIERIGFQTGQRQDLRILMDNGYSETVAGAQVTHEAVSWPFEWYLRDFKNRRYYTRTFGADVNLREYPVILAMAPNIEPIRDQLGDYVGHKYRLNWWFPEDYKAWASNPGAIVQTLSDPNGRARFLKFLFYREPLNILGAREFYLFVRKEVPTLGPASTAIPAAPGARPVAVPGAPRVGAIEQIDPSLALFGVNPQGEPLFVEPKGIAVAPDGKVYVAEGRGNRVTILNQDGSVAGTFGRPGSGDGEFAEPWGVAVAPSGEVFVADTWNHRIQKLTADGRPIGAWGGVADTKGEVQAQPGKFFGPRDVAIGPDGLLYVSDTGNKRIQVFDTNGGFVRAFGGAGDGPGQFNEPVGLAFSGDTLLVADAWNGRIQQLDPSGAARGAIPVQGWENRGITNKPYLAVGPSGQIYATLPERGGVVEVSASGQARPLDRPADRSGRLGLPTGVDVAPDGTIWVTESAGGVVSRYAGGPR